MAGRLALSGVALVAGLAVLGRARAQELDPAPPADSVRQAEALCETRRFDEAATLLRRHLAADAHDLAARRYLARILDWCGQPDQAIAVLEAARTSPDARRDAAAILARQAAEGPNVGHQFGAVVHSGRDAPVVDEAWKAARRARAIDGLRVALALAPPDWPSAPSTAVRLAGLQRRAGDVAAAVSTLSAQRTARATPALLDALARDLRALGRDDEARPVLEELLAIEPRASDAHAALALHLEREGEVEPARDHRRRARFFAWVPGFLDVPYDEATAGTVALLASDALAAADLGVSLDGPSRSAAVAALTSRDEPVAASLLAALVWHDLREGDGHGRLPARTAQALDALGALKSGAGPLCALTEQFQDPHSLRRLLPVLTRHRGDEGVLELLTRILPADIHHMFEVDAAGALVALGDVRAVPALIAVLAPDRGATPQHREEHLRGYGVDKNRQRCALALGRLPPTDAGRVALEAGLGQPPIRLACAAALFRREGAPRKAELLAALEVADFRTYQVEGLLREFTDPDVQAAVAAWWRRVDAR